MHQMDWHEWMRVLWRVGHGRYLDHQPVKSAKRRESESFASPAHHERPESTKSCDSYAWQAKIKSQMAEMIDLLNDWLKGKETDKQIVYGFLSFRLYYQFHAYLSWFSVGSPSSVQQDCRGCSWGYRGPCWLALVTVTAGKKTENPRDLTMIERKIHHSDLHFKPLSKNPSHGFPQQISDMCCFFLSKK